MSYHLKLAGESLQDGLRRVAISQIDKALDELQDETLPPGETVHQVRKRCKKLRGLIRLVRPAFKDYKQENAAFRDAARPLADARESVVLIETLDALLAAFDDELAPQAFTGLRDLLVHNVTEQTRNPDLADKLADFEDAMIAARDRVEGWTLDETGFDAVADGLAKTYRRARKQAPGDDEEPDAKHLHRWRKRAKYHWYHTRLMRQLWPDMVKRRRNLTDDLGDLLGDHHDLEDFRLALPEITGDDSSLADQVDLLTGLAAQRQAQLEKEALPLGRRLFAEKPRAFTKRWQAYWTLVQAEN